MGDVFPTGRVSRASLPSGATRIWNWDTLRWLATFDIVVFHTTGGHGAFGFGLPIYLVMTCALGARPGPGVRAELVRRVRRLVVPWLWGCALYAATLALEASLRGQPPLGWFSPAQLLYGPRVHLWFLPFACAAGVVAAALAPPLRSRRVGLASLLLAVLVAAAGLLAARPPETWPFTQWAFSLPALALGLAFGLRLSSGTRQPLFAVVLALLAVAWLDSTTAALGTRFLGATALLVLALELPQRRVALLERYTPALLGVYVLHPWVFRVLVHDTLWRVGLGSQAWARAGCTFVLALLLSVAASRIAAQARVRRASRSAAALT